MNYVFDASFVGALIIPDENNHQVNRMYKKLKNEDEKYTPHLLWYEITNMFRNLIRRRRFTLDKIMLFYPRFTAFQLKYDNEKGADYSRKLLHICNEYDLSSYDAAYLELAERKNAILCTLDEKLRTAAKKYGVAVLD